MLQFGVSIDPRADALASHLEVARAADRLGVDLVGIQDHPYNVRLLDTWTLITWLAARTERVRFWPNVANLPLRPPAMLAKAAASLDLLTGGRVEVGLGAGAFWTGIRAMGGPARTPGESVAALEEAIEVMRLVWSDRPAARFHGRYYSLDGFRPGPHPAHPIGIWLGAYKPRMLELTGRLADGWSVSTFYESDDGIARLSAAVTAAAERAGRDPRSIRRNLNIGGTVEAPEPLASRLRRLVETAGIDTITFWPEADPVEQLERFMTEVAPALR